MAKYRKDSLLYRQVQPLKDALLGYYKNVAIGMFDWEGMPDSIPIRYPERWLYESGACVYCEPDGLDAVVLPVAYTNINKNLYGEPAQWRAVGIGEYASKINSKVMDDTNSVLIRNDQLYKPSEPYIRYMVDQMINVELTTRMNINANKMPFLFKGTQNTILQNKETFMNIYDCEPVMFKEDFAKSEFEILNNEVPFIAESLTKIYDVYNFRILSYLGINSIPIEKSERLLVSEANANIQEREYIRNARLEQRNIACESINKLFNQNVSVKYTEFEEQIINGNEPAGNRSQGDGFGNGDGKSEE